MKILFRDHPITSQKVAGNGGGKGRGGRSEEVKPKASEGKKTWMGHGLNEDNGECSKKKSDGLQSSFEPFFPRVR